MVDRAEFKNEASKLIALLGKPDVSELFPSLAWLDMNGIGRETKRLRHTFEAIFDTAIRLKRTMGEKKGSKKDILEILLEMHESEDDRESISMDQLKGILMVCVSYEFIISLRIISLWLD